jgi:hypothetical protein
MEFKTLFEILASYLTFVLDFSTLSGMEKFSRIGEVSPPLVSYFVAGTLLAYVISRLKSVPGYEKLADGTQGQEPPLTSEGSLPKGVDVDAPDMAAFIFMSILGMIAFHSFLLLFRAIFGGPEIGNVKDTLNAAFAVNAVYNPLNAFLKRLQRSLRDVTAQAPGCAVIVASLMLLISLVYFGSTYYWIYALASVHGTSKTFMLKALILPIIAGLILGFWLAFARRQNSQKE